MHPHDSDQRHVAVEEPLAARIPVAMRISGFSRSELYRRAGWPDGTPGKITLLKCGKSTLVDLNSLRAAVASLPKATIRPHRIA